jgi:hypothetical protein
LHNGALAATKWWETTQNVSFGPKVVDWMRFVWKIKKYSIGPNSCPNDIPGRDFAMVHLRLPNGAKLPKT